mgnify:CR=1 FL=1
MKKKHIYEAVSYSEWNTLAEVLESCMEKFSTYQAITDKYNNIYLTYGELKEEMNLFASGLQSLGIKNISMITGDTEASAKIIAHEIGIFDVYAGLLPENKVDIVAQCHQKDL